jgi:hypothetical protein
METDESLVTALDAPTEDLVNFQFLQAPKASYSASIIASIMQLRPTKILMWKVISTNNIAIGLVRVRKIRFRPTRNTLSYVTRPLALLLPEPRVETPGGSRSHPSSLHTTVRRSPRLLPTRRQRQSRCRLLYGRSMYTQPRFHNIRARMRACNRPIERLHIDSPVPRTS